MSQFLSVSGREKPIIEIEEVSVLDMMSTQSLIKEVSGFYEFPVTNTWAIGDGDGDTIDDLFSEAIYQFSIGNQLSNTKLARVLGKLINRYSIIAWYGSEYYDLDVVENLFDLYELLDKELQETYGEIYLNIKLCFLNSC